MVEDKLLWVSPLSHTTRKLLLLTLCITPNYLPPTLLSLNILYITLPYVSLKLFYWEPYWAVVVAGYIHTAFSHLTYKFPF